MDKRIQGIASALVGASLWGVSGTCSQYLLANYAISSLFITMVRASVSAVLFLLIITIRRREVFGEVLADARILRQLIAFGVIGLFASQITYLVAIGYTNGGTATVLQSTSIVIIMAVTCIRCRRAPRLLEVTGLIFAFAGTVLIATQGDLGSLSLPAAGLAWGLASAVGATCYSMLPRPLYAKWDSFTVVGLGMAISALASAAIWGAAFVLPGIDDAVNGGNAVGSALVPALDAAGIAALAAISVVGTFGAYYLYLNGISLVGAVRGSQLGAIEPVSATVCSTVFMGTAFSVFDCMGLVLMVATIIMVAAGSRTA